MHIYCLDHVVNLVIQAFLTSINEADNLDENNCYELSKGEHIHYEIDADEEQTALEAEGVDCALNILPTEDFVLEKEECNQWPKCFEGGVLSICMLFY